MDEKIDLKLTAHDVHDAGYYNALYFTIKTRLERRAKYGDAWKKDEDWEILAEITQKTKRLKEIIINKNNAFDYESQVDTLIDLCNYSLFLLQNKLDEENNVGSEHKTY